MISRTFRYMTIAALMSVAAAGNAGTATISPSLAACSKALVETLAKTETLPAYSVKAPNGQLSNLVDPNSYTVYATSKKTNALLAKASCKATPEGEIVSFKSIPVKS